LGRRAASELTFQVAILMRSSQFIPTVDTEQKNR
jgi:hypothetical protein